MVTKALSGQPPPPRRPSRRGRSLRPRPLPPALACVAAPCASSSPAPACGVSWVSAFQFFSVAAFRFFSVSAFRYFFVWASFSLLFVAFFPFENHFRDFSWRHVWHFSWRHVWHFSWRHVWPWPWPLSAPSSSLCRL